MVKRQENRLGLPVNVIKQKICLTAVVRSEINFAASDASDRPLVMSICPGSKNIQAICETVKVLKVAVSYDKKALEPTLMLDSHLEITADVCPYIDFENYVGTSLSGTVTVFGHKPVSAIFTVKSVEDARLVTCIGKDFSDDTNSL